MPLASPQGRYGRVSAMHCAEEVDIHDPAQHIELRVGKRTAVGNTGIVDQHVYAAKAFCGLRHGLLTGVGVGDVACKGEQGADVRGGDCTGQLLQRFECLCVAVQCDDAGTFVQECLHQGSAQSTASAGNDNATARKVTHGLVPEISRLRAPCDKSQTPAPMNR